MAISMPGTRAAADGRATCPAARAGPRRTTGCRPRPSDRHVISSACGPTPSSASIASMIFGPPGCDTQAPTSLDGQPVHGQQIPDVRPEVAVHQLGHLGGQHDAEAVGADVPAHHALGARVQVAAGGQHPRARDGEPVGALRSRRRQRRPPRRRTARWPPGSPSRCRRAAWSASTARRTAGCRRDPASRAGSRATGRSRPHRRRSPSPNSGTRLMSSPEADLGGDPGLQRRDRQPGDGGGEDDVDLVGGDAGRGQRTVDGLHGEFDRGLDEGVVRRGEVGQLLVVVERQREIPAADPGVGVDPPHHLVAGAVARARARRTPR